MFTIERVIKVVKNEEKIERCFFGTGRFTSDSPGVREAGAYKVVSSFGFSLVCDKMKAGSKEKEAEFFPLVLWEKNAENIQLISDKVKAAERELGLEEKGLKGKEVLIFGKIVEEKKVRKDGEEYTVDNLVVDRFEFKDYPKKNHEFTQTENSSTPKYAGEPADDEIIESEYAEIAQEEYDDIPF